MALASLASSSSLNLLKRSLLVSYRQSGLNGFASSSTESHVSEIASDQEFKTELKKQTDAGVLSIVDFTAKWCGPCRAIAPVLEQLSQQHPQVKFYKVDIDNPAVAGTVMDHDISAVPTFTFYKGPQRVETFTGARVDLLRELLTKHGG